MQALLGGRLNTSSCGTRQASRCGSKAPAGPCPCAHGLRQPSGRQLAGASTLCRASDGVNDGVLGSMLSNGPIQINLAAGGGDGMLESSAPKSDKGSKPVDRSKGLWTRCEKCGVILYIKHLKEHHHICFGCNYHLKMTSAERIEHLIDPGTWRSLDDTLSPGDPLEFTDLKPYVDRVTEAQNKTGLQDAVRCGTGLLHGIPVALGVMEFGYMGGSMGSVVGEKLTRLIEYATQEGLTLMIVCTSGGARMQEGIMSLMQMAKISAALHVHQNEAKLLFISLLTSPTTGGVTASFGMLGDLIIAEPQAIIGFAGRRVIEQTLQEQLPDDFQTAEYLLEHGLLDLVVPRSFLKGALYELIDFYHAAPYKAKGRIPYGVQHGTFLASDEKIRRKWNEWASSKIASASSAGEAVVAAAASPLSSSYRELVASFRMLVSSADGGAPPAYDVRDLLKSEEELTEALAMSKTGVMSWIEATPEPAPAAEREYMFRMTQRAGAGGLL